MITANQPQVTNRPVQVRCSSQPIGFRSNFRSIHRRKNFSQNIGVQNVVCHHSSSFEAGRSCQTRLVFRPAIAIAKNKTSREMAVIKPMAQSACPTVLKKLREVVEALTKLTPRSSA